MTSTATTSYPTLFSEWSLRHTTMRNRVVFAPTCPTWVANPYEATFTDQAVAYYEERARHGVGLVVIGGNLISENALYSPFLFPGLWNDAQQEALARVAEAVHRQGARIAVQLLHPGQRTHHTLKTDPAYDLEASWYTVGPSQVPTGELPGSPTPKALEEHEIEQILVDYENAARRAVAAGLDGVEFHMAHGYLPWQFLSPLYNKRTDHWGGSEENRQRFSIEAMRRIRAAIGDAPFLGYRINSTSFWDGDLEIDDVCRTAQAFGAAVDLDYVSLSAGVHHSFIHTPMTYEAGWEREYTRAVKTVTDKPVMLVGRFTHPADAEEALVAGDGDAILLARQMFADEQWVSKAQSGREDDIRRCVAANFCWRAVTRGQRVQCVYNPVVGRERVWGSGTDLLAPTPRRVAVIGAGPSGLEFARVAVGRGHAVTLFERDADIGGHVRAHAALPTRERYGDIATWLGEQAVKGGAELRLSTEVTPDNATELLAGFDHVVVATGSEEVADGFQGQTGAPIPGWDTGRCVAWDDVALGRAEPHGSVVVIDERQDTVAPLVATMLARRGLAVRLVTRWPMVGMETAPEVYLHWMLSHLYDAGVEIVVDRLVTAVDGPSVTAVNVYRADDVTKFDADWVVMATARRSQDSVYRHLRDTTAVPVECIGDALAPRTTYEATFEGHRAARRL